MNPPSNITSSNAPGWYPDPHGRGKRYWDGRSWTGMTRRDTGTRTRSRDHGGWVQISGSCSSVGGY